MCPALRKSLAKGLVVDPKIRIAQDPAKAMHDRLAERPMLEHDRKAIIEDALQMLRAGA